jgi:sulfur carrier protein
MMRTDMDGTARIVVNGESELLAAGTIAALLVEKEIGPDARGVAVALNGAVVPRAAWGETTLRPGDAVEIVRARQGG